MKKAFYLMAVAFLLASCSKISGKYSEFHEGWLGIDNTLSTYEFGMFGKVKYMNSTSGSRSSNSYYSSEGKYEIDGDRVTLNFGGSDLTLKISDDNKTLTATDGSKYTKRDN